MDTQAATKLQRQVQAKEDLEKVYKEANAEVDAHIHDNAEEAEAED